MPAGHRRVGREQRGGARCLDRLVEGEPDLLGELADPLDAEEPGVTLVGVEDLGRGRAGQRGVGPQRTNPADAEQHLLEQTVLAAAAVQPVGDISLGRLVVLDVGVEQQQRHPADLRLPDLRDQVSSAGQPDAHLERFVVLGPQQRDRQPVGVEHGIALLLPALPGERLREIAGAIEQAHPDDGDTEVGGRLEVVTGQDAEPAGVLRQHGGDAELGREVGDGARHGTFGIATRCRPCARAGGAGTSGPPRGRCAGCPPPPARGVRRRRPPRVPRAGRVRGPRAGAPGLGRPPPRRRGRDCGRAPATRRATTTAG